MTKPKITLYVDTVSPFAYLAYRLLRTSPVFQACDITYKPIFLGGVMKSTGNKPPLSVPSKGVWINEARRRWARLYDIPMSDDTPDNFPVLTLTIQRALVAIDMLYPDKLVPALDILYQKMWVDRNVEGIDKPEALGKTLAATIGNDATKDIMGKMSTDEVKKLLNAKSEEAVEAGAFGLPWFVATNSKGETESFWGFDHIGQLCAFLDLEKPSSGGWRAMM